ncbi:MAG: metalloregulator ArsR/SmtB family transcription factor [Solirubrobacteraceae bacterium MAG38_C4-C5]|nr:metalloregulator ArsR/SmtB family transcription factor [Candidatus Siliceabacter maunaloa]
MAHGVEGKPPRPGHIDPATADAVAVTMQALATPSRVRILGRLREGACSVGELAASVELEPSAASHQLRLLRHLGLVVGQRTGRQVIYTLHDDHVGALLDEAIFHTEHLRLGTSQLPRRWQEGSA